MCVSVCGCVCVQVNNYYVDAWVNGCAHVGVWMCVCACGPERVCVSVHVLVSAVVRACMRVHLSLSDQIPFLYSCTACPCVLS